MQGVANATPLLVIVYSCDGQIKGICKSDSEPNSLYK